MRDLKSARAMLIVADRELQALRNMLDPDKFPIEIFGFHAQQAVEKSLKAWLLLNGKEYPTTHNVRLLIVLLDECGADVADLWELSGLTAFAVQFRYETFAALDEGFDRNAILEHILTVVQKVEKHLNQAEGML